jgi:hypothetical protein
MGGMGNQMLQYALGRHLSVKTKSRLYLDLSWYKDYDNSEYPREFRLGCFHARYRTVNPGNILWKLRFTSRFKRFNPFRLNIVQEQDLSRFAPGVLEAGDNIVLEGYFPSYKYFEPIRNLLLKEFRPKEKMDATNAACLERIQNSNSVGIHIRRGDYAKTDFHGMLQNDYYAAGIKLVAEKAGPVRLFIFSDEPDWVQENMQFDYPYELISFNRDEKNFFDMELMKNCRHNIIANSTFSWWSAWLNENHRKIVVAPQRWFNQENPPALIPQDWHVI